MAITQKMFIVDVCNDQCRMVLLAFAQWMLAPAHVSQLDGIAAIDFCMRGLVLCLLHQCSSTGVPQNMQWGSLSFKGSVRVPHFLGELISCFGVLMCHYVIFRSPRCIQTPSRPVTCTGGWLQIVAQETFRVFVSLVHCAIKKNVIVAL